MDLPITSCISLCLAIIDQLETARYNQKHCRNLKQLVETIQQYLQQMHNRQLTPAGEAAVGNLRKLLEKADRFVGRFVKMTWPESLAKAGRLKEAFGYLSLQLQSQFTLIGAGESLSQRPDNDQIQLDCLLQLLDQVLEREFLSDQQQVYNEMETATQIAVTNKSSPEQLQQVLLRQLQMLGLDELSADELMEAFTKLQEDAFFGVDDEGSGKPLGTQTEEFLVTQLCAALQQQADLKQQPAAAPRPLPPCKAPFKSFECPISHELMVRPVILLETRQTYERACIERWLDGHNTCPLTGQQLTQRPAELVDNISLRQSIEEWAEQHNIKLGAPPVYQRPFLLLRSEHEGQGAAAGGSSSSSGGGGSGTAAASSSRSSSGGAAEAVAGSSVGGGRSAAVGGGGADTAAASSSRSSGGAVVAGRSGGSSGGAAQAVAGSSVGAGRGAGSNSSSNSAGLTPTGVTQDASQETEQAPQAPRIWKCTQSLEMLDRRNDTIEGCALSPDGRTLVTAGVLGQLWDVGADGCTPRQYPDPGSERRILARCCAFSPDGHTILVGSCTRVTLWDSASGSCIKTLPTDYTTFNVFSCAFSPDGCIVAAGCAGGSPLNTLKLWEVASGKCIRTLAHSSPVTGCAFSPDGCTLVSGSLWHTLKVWNLQSGKCKQEIRIKSRPCVLCCALSPDGRTLAVGTDDGQLQVWGPGRFRPGRFTETQTLMGHIGDVSCCAFSPDGSTLVSGSRDDGTLIVWDLPSGARKQTLIFEGPIEPPWSSHVACCAMSDHTLVAGFTISMIDAVSKAKLWHSALGVWKLC